MTTAAKITATSALSESLAAAVEAGSLTPDQLRELIAFEAAQIGLSFEEAVRLGRLRQLPKTLYGRDVEMLVAMLPA